MDQALNAYYTITASSEFREKERLYAKARHDEAQALYHAEQKGEQKKALEVAKKLKEMGVPSDQISQATELSHSEIERL